jgi:IS30 family transposase
MAEIFNIHVLTTAAYSPWSNGLNEKYNGVIGNMVRKI